MVDSAQHIGGFDTVPPAEDDAAKSIDLNNGSNPVATPKDSPDAVSRIEAFRRLYNTSKKQTFFWVAFVCWALALDISSATTGLYLSFATSFFGQHPILSTITLLTAVMAAVIQPFWGKLADMAARPICLLLSLLLYTLGYIISASSQTVTGLAVGQVIYSLGNIGLSFLQSLIVADVTTLRNRGLAYGMVSFIYLPFAFVSSNIAAGVGLENWRWGYGMFCVMMPVCVAPILGMLFWADRKAKQQLTAEKGPAEVVKAPLANRIRRTLALVDPLGLILIGFAFSLLLCPPTLYASAVGGWSNPSMIAMEVVGGVIFILFIIWEWKFAAHPLFPLRVFKLNYLLCLFTTIMLFLVTGVYNTYWTSWIWVVKDYDESQWTYMSIAGSAALCFFSLVAGVVQHYTRRYKIMMISGNAIVCIAAGIIYFSATAGNTSTVALVFSQVLFQGGAAFALMAAQTAFQASVSHDDLAIALAVYIFAESLCNGIGASAAGSMWTSSLVANLEAVPGLNVTDVLSIAGDITLARISEPRADIIVAYDKTYRRMALAALILTFPSFIASFFNREIVLDNRHNIIDEESPAV